MDSTHFLSPNALMILVDDDPEGLKVFRALLSSAEISRETIEFRGGGDAVSFLEGYLHNQYPLPLVMFLDLQTPRLNGFQLLCWLRSHARFDSLAVIVLGPPEKEKNLETVLRLGVNHFLYKYPKAAELRRVFEEVITRRTKLAFNLQVS